MAGEALEANAAQRRYWNTVAGPRWVAAPGFRERRNQESTALLLARLGITGGENVLEIGCGTGALTVPLAAAVADHGRLVAVDISEPMLGVARQRVEERGLHNVKLLLGDAQVFEFELAAFDRAHQHLVERGECDPRGSARVRAGECGGERAVLIGIQGSERITAEEVARRLETINYEITCALTPRVPRVYHRDGVAVDAVAHGARARTADAGLA